MQNDKDVGGTKENVTVSYSSDRLIPIRDRVEATDTGTDLNVQIGRQRDCSFGGGDSDSVVATALANNSCNLAIEFVSGIQFEACKQRIRRAWFRKGQCEALCEREQCVGSAQSHLDHLIGHIIPGSETIDPNYA